MRYDKLIRDRIPEIIRTKGGTPVVHTAGDVEYAKKLKEKLQEEVDEFKKDASPEELADILEVVHALAELCGSDIGTVEEIRKKKKEERGGFSKRIILEES